MGRHGLDASHQGPVAGCFEHSNEPLGPIKGQEFNWLSNYQLLKKHSMELVTC
jgi:hypothetical protein